MDPQAVPGDLEEKYKKHQAGDVDKSMVPGVKLGLRSHLAIVLVSSCYQVNGRLLHCCLVVLVLVLWLCGSGYAGCWMTP